MMTKEVAMRLKGARLVGLPFVVVVVVFWPQMGRDVVLCPKKQLWMPIKN